MVAFSGHTQCIYFEKLSAGPQADHCLGIAKNGTLWGWGDNQFGQVGNNLLINAEEPIQISAATGWKEVAAGTGHSLAIDANGKLWGWGNDGEGQLGDGAAVGIARNVLTPEHITSANSIWKAVAAAGSHSNGRHCGW